jgi:chorismate mutase
MRLFAIRGAVPVVRNDSASILAATRELMGEIVARNGLTPADFVSCLFTVTGDLNAEFPARAARELGFDEVPLMCAVEIDVPGAMRSVIRVMAHYHAAEDHTPAHVYLGDAQKLRTDLHSAQ